MKQKYGYQTKNQKRILDFVISQKDAHFSANDAYRYFVINGVAISMPTIYRQLDKMTADGFVQKYRTEVSETAYYYHLEGSVDSNEQSHMKCTSCGKIFSLECHSAEELAEHIGREHHFFVRLAETVFYGQCEVCSHT